ncbi:hypothetical protein H310_05962 [Aphanomyces invadans]|uniref:DUF4097 domain-containing protein n=1 Tax=Aphanomyces invadans TaxID=157072 RepID=A0A024UA39_9STRA|nr:hypothetical protein H310_05962 [Aphanomyces invadans]ETW02453.1 hypothetical protein H310_05962 [Aphanomyces invadans]|eukprot:XP_008869058.1 hypothetical protein H310_05962 [Aphanomyces invadans]
MSAMQPRTVLRQTTLPQAIETTPLIRRFCLVNFVLCLGAAPMFFVFANKAMTFQVLYAAAGALALSLLLASAMSALKSTPSLVWSMMFTVASAYGLICTGGLCVLYLPYASAELTSATDLQYAKSVVLPSELKSQAVVEQVYLQVGGTVQLVLGLFASYQVRLQFYVLGEKRASVAFLQAFSAFMVPLSLLFIAGGQYIISSQTLASAPYTGIFIYICGLLVLVLSLLAFIGSGFEYRRLLNTFSWLAFLTAVLLLGASIACLAVTTNVQKSVINNWGTIRVMLPPTLQARYDKSQFVLFVERNLHGMAYVGIISGLFMLLQSLSAQSVREIMNVVKRRAAQDKRCALDPELHPEFVARREWTLMFKSSKRIQRICMRVVCGFATLLLLAITVVMTLSVVFTTQCASISKAVEWHSFGLGNGSTPAAVSCESYHLQNTFAAGRLQLVRGDTLQGNVTFQQNAVSDKFLAVAAFSSTIDAQSVCTVAAAPTNSPTFMWFDTSCQVANVKVELPRVTERGVVPFVSLSSKTSAIDINLIQNGTSTLVQGVNITTDLANVNGYGMYIGSGGLSVTSASGELNMSTVFVNATQVMGDKTPTVLTSSLGSVSLANASLVDSPLTMYTDVAGIAVQNVMTSVSHGRSNVALSSGSGGIVVSDLSADWISMETTSGAITTDGLSSNGDGAFTGRIDVTSIGGDVRLLNTNAKGYIHVETNSGNVVVHLASATFVGLYYVRSEYGLVTVRYSNSSYDSVKALPTADPHEAQGLINCDTSCHYVGDIYIRTIYGNIDVLVGCKDTTCA